jgi:hypothetical protein
MKNKGKIACFLKTPYIYLMILYTKNIPFLASKFDLLCMSYLNIAGIVRYDERNLFSISSWFLVLLEILRSTTGIDLALRIAASTKFEGYF